MSLEPPTGVTMVYYNAQLDLIGLLIIDSSTEGKYYHLLEINEQGYGVIPYTTDRWTYVGAI